MRIIDVREKVLRNFISRTPGGAKELAEVAISCLSGSALKKLVEALDLEQKVNEVKRSKK